MVIGTSLGLAFDRSYQMEITTVDLAASGLNLTSALKQSVPDSVQKTTKDAIKRKLTARVSPMTRQTKEFYDPRFISQISGQKTSQHPNVYYVKQEQGGNSATAACSSHGQNGQKRLIKKRKSLATNVIIPKQSVNSDSSHKTREEPASKRPRTILPRTNLSQQGKFIK